MDLVGTILLGRFPGVAFRDLFVDGKKQKCAVIPLSHPAYYTSKNGFHRLKIRIFDYINPDTNERVNAIFPVDKSDKLQITRNWLLKRQTLGIVCEEEKHPQAKLMESELNNNSTAITAYGKICLDDIPESKIEIGTDGKRYVKVSFFKMHSLTSSGYTHALRITKEGKGKTCVGATDPSIIGYFTDWESLRVRKKACEGFNFNPEPKNNDKNIDQSSVDGYQF